MNHHHKVISRVLSSHIITPDQLVGLKYPLFASPKLNGIRAYFNHRCALVSKTAKLIPNAYIRAKLEMYSTYPLDGEHIAGETYEETKSNVMSDYKKCDFTFYVFDWISDVGYVDRYTRILKELSSYPHMHLVVVPSGVVESSEQALFAYNKFREQPYPSGEGMILRDPHGLYKEGRSTVNEQYSLKLKDVETSDAIIYGVEQWESQGAKKEAVGALRCRLEDGRTFRIGTGFEEQERYELYQKQLLGQYVTFSYLPACSKDGLPSQAVFIKLGREHSNVSTGQ